MVQAEKLDNVSIADAIKRGDYYSSTGPKIEHFYQLYIGTMDRREATDAFYHDITYFIELA